VPPRTTARPRPRGVVTAICAVTGVQDEVGDVILPGAFTETFKKRPVKPVFSHEWKDPIGVCHQVQEWAPGDARLPKTTTMGEPWPKEAGALVAQVGFNMRTTRGRDVYEQVKQWHEEGGGAQWSIGYVVPEGGATKRSGVRIIHRLDLYEVSPVLHGAHPLTMALEVKGSPAAAGPELEYKATPGPAQPHGETNTDGVMVALFPAADVAEQLADPQGSAAEELHITLAYLGPAAELGGHPDDLPDEIRMAVAGSPQLEGTLGGIGRFPDSGNGVPVWVPADVPGLTALQQRIADRLATSVFSERFRQDHGFTPHLTLGYDLPEDTPAVDPLPVTFDQVYVVRGAEKVPIPLGQPDPVDQPEPAPADGPPADGQQAAVEVKSARQAVAVARELPAARRPLETKTARQAVLEAKALPTTGAQAPALEEKSMHGPMAGSYEELRGRISDAVQTLFKPNGDGDDGDCWVCVESTFPDHVIVSVEKPGEQGACTYSVPYELEGGEVELGEPQHVELTVVAVPDGASDEDLDEVGPDESTHARFIAPAAASLDDATSAVAVADVQPEQLEHLRPAVERLLATLSRKGLPIGEEDDPYADDFDGEDWGYRHHDESNPDDSHAEGDADAAASDGPTAPTTGASGQGDTEAQGDEQDGNGGQITMDPKQVEDDLKSLDT